MKKVTDRPDCAADVVVKLSEMFIQILSRWNPVLSIVCYGNVINQYGEFRRMLIEHQWVSVHFIESGAVIHDIVRVKNKCSAGAENFHVDVET